MRPLSAQLIAALHLSAKHAATRAELKDARLYLFRDDRAIGDIEIGRANVEAVRDDLQSLGVTNTAAPITVQSPEGPLSIVAQLTANAVKLGFPATIRANEGTAIFHELAQQLLALDGDRFVASANSVSFFRGDERVHVVTSREGRYAPLFDHGKKVESGTVMLVDGETAKHVDVELRDDGTIVYGFR